MRRSSGDVVVSAASMILLLALAGCSTAPPVGHTDAELQEYVELQNMSNWSQQPRDIADRRPEVPVVRFLNEDEFLVVYECMADAGVPVEYGADGGVSWSWNTDTHDDFGLIQYTCQAQYPFYPPQMGSFTDEQHAYLYDYYQDVLIPCLLMHGYSVTGEAPTREEFNDLTAVDSFWNPYSFTDVPLERPEMRELYSECPRIPFRAPVAELTL